MAEKKDKYELVQIPTQTEIAFRDTDIEKEEESILQEKEVLRRIANDISELKRALI